MSGGDHLEQDLVDRVVSAIADAPGVTDVRLVGSRATGRNTSFSDWDFEVTTEFFVATKTALPRAALQLRPVVAQWDRLNDTWCYMLILRGPTKVDLIFDEPHRLRPPWEVKPSTLAGIDDHFWDWLLWLRSKEASGKSDLIRAELEKMYEHLLQPLGVDGMPSTLLAAIESYRQARAQWEDRFGISVSRLPEHAVTPVFRRVP